MTRQHIPLSRTYDPQTSVIAALRVVSFKARHEALILEALRVHGPMTKDGIASVTRLDAVQVARRGRGMERAGLVMLGPDTFEGCRVWRRA